MTIHVNNDVLIYNPQIPAFIATWKVGIHSPADLRRFSGALRIHIPRLTGNLRITCMWQDVPLLKSQWDTKWGGSTKLQSVIFRLF